MKTRLFALLLVLVVSSGLVLTSSVAAQEGQGTTHISAYTGVVTESHVVYSNDFEGDIGPEWSSKLTSVTPAGARRFLGQFGNDVVQLSLSDLPSHSNVTVSFDLFVIGSWDGNGNYCCGPDVWKLSINDGPVLLHTTFSNTGGEGNRQAYPDMYPGGDHPARSGATENFTLGYPRYGSEWGDAVYHLDYTFR